ncbi:tyrosine-type recombinase/integrase [Flammeovirga sp. SubArs3]|uniref:tyrosine-type recombinase/integrase n=1 Tax=Flammeovirga sp. SubArs3 TaxID=2995316 RepID=UPI00248D07B7|nr:tyrosine-type recombinase/integrase [Flammeovirga sp. SubArs3]
MTKALTSFLNYLEFEKKVSKHTLTAYSTDLLQFQSFLLQEDQNAALVTANKAEIRLWVASLMDTKKSTRSINRKIASLKSFYKHLRKHELITIDPSKSIHSIKTPSRIPQHVKASEMDGLFKNETFDDSFTGVRDKLILEFLYGTGTRASELLGIEVQDLDFKSQSIKVLGKRNKERIIPLHTILVQQLKNYLSYRKAFDTSQLFVTETGTPLKYHQLYTLVKRYLSTNTTVSRKSPHILRHSFATTMLENGASLNDIKELLGHTNLSATQIYTHSSLKRMKNVHVQAHPRAQKKS